jgi:ABC-type antimicrobial peptide transport system permease subunit
MNKKRIFFGIIVAILIAVLGLVAINTKSSSTTLFVSMDSTNSNGMAEIVDKFMNVESFDRKYEVFDSKNINGISHEYYLVGRGVSVSAGNMPMNSCKDGVPVGPEYSKRQYFIMFHRSLFSLRSSKSIDLLSRNFRRIVEENGGKVSNAPVSDPQCPEDRGAAST